jgi:hypothetical protein
LQVKVIQDKDQSPLDAISETVATERLIVAPPKSATSAPVINRKASVISAGRKPSNENLSVGTAVPRRDVSASSFPAIREARARPRPLSVTGIPSPSPTRNSSLHTRKDKYEGLGDDGHRRAASVRSVSTKIENRLNPENRLQIGNSRTIVPPRESSKRVIQEPPRTKKEVPPPPVSKDTLTHKRQSSRDNTSSLHPKAKTLKPQPSKDLAPPTPRETVSTPLRKQRSKDLSPTPSTQSSPKPKSKLTSINATDPPPEQTRLLQLLHLIPLSERTLATYESSAHKTLSTKYVSLQSRFQTLQKQDHAKTLTETLTTLKSWSDGHIRSLSNLLIDWESLTIDLRTFCKRLQNTLKPINKSVLEEKGIFPPQPPWLMYRSIIFKIT